MKVYDIFPFFNELDLLMIRMEILDKHVDYFVIGECDKTFQGKSKPFYYLENKDRFKKFEHKIIHNKFIDTHTDWTHWDRDKNHKDVLMNSLINCNDNDIILLSDLDEIPNLDQHPINIFYQPNHLFHFMMNMYYYYINILREENWYGTKLCSFSYFKHKGFTETRNIKNEGTKIYNGGWHFSFMGGPEKVKEKIESWGHVEFNNSFIKNNILNNINNNQDVFFRKDAIFKKVNIDNSYPQYLLNNLDKYKHLIKI